MLVTTKVRTPSGAWSRKPKTFRECDTYSCGLPAAHEAVPLYVLGSYDSGDEVVYEDLCQECYDAFAREREDARAELAERAALGK